MASYIRPSTRDLVGELVCPVNRRVLNLLIVSNGAVMFLNTFMMQELVRRYFDEVLDREDEGSQFEKLFIYTVSKGMNNLLYGHRRRT